ncbi:MAG: sulfatase-like hydrolase/transferase [Oscillospiraceae bacterium]
MSVSNQGQKPNIVFILTDDQGAWAMGCAGNKEIKTPNLDRLAQSGMRFSNFFCASPVCSPARASIMTGTIPSAHGVQDWLRGGNIDIEQFPQLKGDPVFSDEHKAIPYLQDFTPYTDVLARNGTPVMNDGISIRSSMVEIVYHRAGHGDITTLLEDDQVVYRDRYITDLIGDKAHQYLGELGGKSYQRALSFC